MVAFSAAKSGETEIWVKSTGGGDAIQVTKNGFYNQYPVWSDDGQDIAFFSRRASNNGIWRVAFTGGQELQVINGIAPSARPIRWSNGKIYYRDGNELFVADEKSGDRKQLTDLASQGIQPLAMTISRDGSKFAVSVRDGDVFRIKTGRSDFESFVEVATSKGQIENICFHPNGNSVFYSASIDGTLQIFRADGQGAAPIQISNGNADVSIQDVSADGTKVLYGSIGETSDLWTVDSQTLQEAPVANDVPLEFWPDLSPDGRSVVFQSVEQPDRPFRSSIVVKDLSASTGSNVVSSEGFATIWSHDGSSIAFFRRTDNGFGIWKVGRTGADAMKLVDGLSTPFSYLGTPYLKRGIGHLSWSPDDQALAYSYRSEGISNIWLVRLNGTRANPLTLNTDPNETYDSPVWTADGKYIVFVSQGASMQGGSKVYRLWRFGIESSEQQLAFESTEPFLFTGFVSGREQAVIAENPNPSDQSPTPAVIRVYLISLESHAKEFVAQLDKAYLYNIQVSRDGRTIAYITRRDNVSELWTVAVAGGKPKKILVENDPKNLISSMSWSPDNKTIIFGKQSRTNTLSILAN